MKINMSLVKHALWHIVGFVHSQRKPIRLINQLLNLNEESLEQLRKHMDFILWRRKEELTEVEEARVRALIEELGEVLHGALILEV